MPLDTFRTQLKTLPTGASDFNFICAATYAEYNALLITAKTMMFPLTMVHSQMQMGLDLINDTSYKTLKGALNDVNGCMKQILKTPIKDLKEISKDIGNVGNALAHSCEFFLSSLPEALFNMFQDLQYGIADIANGLMKIPNALTNSIFDSLMKFKTDALSGILGGLYDTVLGPILAFEDFIKEMGIKTLLDKLEKMEICMMKPGTCHRSPKDFTEPTSHKPWSKYLRQQFMVTKSGKPNFNLISSNSQQSNRASVVHKNFMSYINF